MDEAGIAQALQMDLNSHNVKIQVKRKETQLHILITRSEQNGVDYNALYDAVKNGLENLEVQSPDGFVMYGRVAGTKQPEWQKNGTIEIREPERDPEAFALDMGDDYLQIHDSHAEHPDDAGIEREHLELMQILDSEPRPIEPPPLPIVPKDEPEESRASPWNAYFIPIAAIVGLLIAGGGWFFWDSSIQQQKLAEASATAAKVFDPAQLKGLEALSQSQQEIDRAMNLLGEIPDRPGSPYSEAQEKLAALRGKYTNVNQKLTIEKTAAGNLTKAKSLAKEASDGTKATPTKLDAWQGAQMKWQDAIQLLEAIPPTTFVATEAEKILPEYRTNFRTATAQVQKQRLVQAATIYWGKKVSPTIKNELRQLKTAKTPKAEFVKACIAKLRPSVDAVAVQKQGFRANSFLAAVCNAALSSKS